VQHLSVPPGVDNDFVQAFQRQSEREFKPVLLHRLLALADESLSVQLPAEFERAHVDALEFSLIKFPVLAHDYLEQL